MFRKCGFKLEHRVPGVVIVSELSFCAFSHPHNDTNSDKFIDSLLEPGWAHLCSNQ